jgi:hypothetical protein
LRIWTIVFDMKLEYFHRLFMSNNGRLLLAYKAIKISDLQANYSARKAITGSTRVARLPGSQAASAATTASINVTPP